MRAARFVGHIESIYMMEWERTHLEVDDEDEGVVVLDLLHGRLCDNARVGWGGVGRVDLSTMERMVGWKRTERSGPRFINDPARSMIKQSIKSSQ